MNDIPRQEAGTTAASPAQPPWHTLPVEEVAAQLGVEVGRGLPAGEVERRRGLHGPNALREAPARHWSVMLLGQFKDFMILVLLAAALISGLIGAPADSIAILVIVVLNAAVR